MYYILIICHLHFTSKPVNLNNIIFIKIKIFHLFPSHRAVSYLQTCSSNIAKPSELLLFVFFIFNKCHWTYSGIFNTINSHLSIPRNKTSLVPVQSEHASCLLTLSNKIEWYKVATKFELPILIANLNRHYMKGKKCEQISGSMAKRSKASVSLDGIQGVLSRSSNLQHRKFCFILMLSGTQ